MADSLCRVSKDALRSDSQSEPHRDKHRLPDDIDSDFWKSSLQDGLNSIILSLQ